MRQDAGRAGEGNAGEASSEHTGGMRRDRTRRRRRTQRGKKKALCGNRRPSNDCLPYEKSSKIDVDVSLSSERLCHYLLPAVTKIMTRKYFQKN